MKHIRKNINNQPAAFRRFRETENAIYSGYVDKDLDTGENKPLKKALAIEQGWICCYCNRRLTIDTITVEHFIPQKKSHDSPFSDAEHSSNSLNYMNLLASCNTLERNCSEERGNTPLIRLNPKNAECENLVAYEKGTGYITPVENHPYSQEVNRDLKTLLLNPPIGKGILLQSRRFDVISELIKSMKNRTWTRRELEMKIEEWSSLRKIDSEGTLGYREFCMAAVWYLRQKLKRPRYSR